MSGYFYVFYGLHLLGVFGSGTLLLFVPFLWFANHWRSHRVEIPLRSLLARVMYAGTTVAYGACFMYFGSAVEDQVVPVCSTLQEQSLCDKWPLLTVAQCDAARGCLNETKSDTCAGFLAPNFKCAWKPPSRQNNLTALFGTYGEPASCVRHSCPLDEYARGVVFEFGVLILTLCYVATFALHDMRRLLDRKPPAQIAMVDTEVWVPVVPLATRGV